MSEGTPIGIYTHFKGGTYEVFGEAVHTETKERLVLYREVNTQKFHARPHSMFFNEAVNEKGETVPRFKLFQANV